MKSAHDAIRDKLLDTGIIDDAGYRLSDADEIAKAILAALAESGHLIVTKDPPGVNA